MRNSPFPSSPVPGSYALPALRNFFLIGLLFCACGAEEESMVETQVREIRLRHTAATSRRLGPQERQLRKQTMQEELVALADRLLEEGVPPEERLPLAELLYQTGRFQASLQLIEQILAGGPDSEALELQIQIFAGLGRMKAAQTALQSVADPAELAWSTFEALANGFRQQGHLQQALEYQEKAIIRLLQLPEADRAYVIPTLLPMLAGRLVDGHLESEDPQVALEALQRILKASPNDPMAAEVINGMALQLGKQWQARQIRQSLPGTPMPWQEPFSWIGPGQANLQDWQGKVLLLDFFAFWCAPCIQAFPWLRRLQEQYGAEGLQVLGLTRLEGRFQHREIQAENLNAEQELAHLKTFRKDHQLSHPFAVFEDFSLFEQYGVESLPTLVLVDRQGMIRHLHVGTGHETEIEQQIQALLAE